MKEKKIDGFPLPHTQFKAVFVLLTLGCKYKQLLPTRTLYRTNRKICWPLSMIDKTGLSLSSPCRKKEKKVYILCHAIFSWKKNPSKKSIWHWFDFVRGSHILLKELYFSVQKGPEISFWKEMINPESF